MFYKLLVLFVILSGVVGGLRDSSNESIESCYAVKDGTTYHVLRQVVTDEYVEQDVVFSGPFDEAVDALKQCLVDVTEEY